MFGTWTIGSMLSCISVSVVAQLRTLIRMAVRPCTQSHHQHTPPAWRWMITARVAPGDLNETSTWFSTRFFEISNP